MALLWPMESLTALNQNANRRVMLVELAVNCSADRKLMCPNDNFLKFKVFLMTILKVVTQPPSPRFIWLCCFIHVSRRAAISQELDASFPFSSVCNRKEVLFFVICLF